MTAAPRNIVQHMAGETTHARRGAIRHRFRYGVDFVLFDPEAAVTGPALFSRGHFNLASVHDVDHGGPIGQGRGAVWARDVLAGAGLDRPELRLALLTQPRFLGYGFNPVSFWLAREGDRLRAVIAEVSTPFGDRHSYLCHLPGFAAITRNARLHAVKALHVSPFQEVAGSYDFVFDIRPSRIRIAILHRNGTEGVVATLSGSLRPLTNAGLVSAALRRPFGALRTMALIHWQALRLKLKGARYRTRPAPPTHEVS